MQQTLVNLNAGQSGTVIAVRGRKGLISQLNRLGIRKGKIITKLSSIFNRGPIIIKVDNYQVAIGYGKACQIIVEVNSDEKNSTGG